jgi:hypothetical protein
MRGQADALVAQMICSQFTEEQKRVTQALMSSASDEQR